MAELPPGFRRLEAGPRRLLVAGPLAGAATRLGLLEPGGLEALLRGAAGPAGRARSAVVALPGRAERLHLRRVRHGGLLGRLRGDWLLGLRRPTRELRATARLLEAGAPVARPALVAAHRRIGPLWTAAVGTLYEERSVDGAAFLASRPPREQVLRAAAAAGDAVRRLHGAGGRHADLHLGNLLVREDAGAPEVRVVDLDRARVLPALSPRRRMAELMRLYRSLVKRGLVDAVGARGCARFLSSYTAGDRALRRALWRHLRRERMRLAVHRLGYRRLSAAATPSSPAAASGPRPRGR